MEPQTYLLFKLNDLPYGIQTANVREIFQLPELTPIADAPGDIIGILNFRGSILPVMHLAKRLGQPMPACHLQDRVIVVDWEGMQVGMVVHQVDDVQSFHPATIEPEPAYGHISPAHTAFVAGVAKSGDRLITLLNSETLIRQTDSVNHMLWGERLNALEQESHGLGVEADLKSAMFEPQDLTPEMPLNEWAPPILTSFFDCYCPDSTSKERELFRHRAEELRHIQSISNTDAFLPLAVMRLGEEYFGLDLDSVKEFIVIRQITPIPCCPPHIIGDINLRGDVVTIVDICKALNLNSESKQSRQAQTLESKTLERKALDNKATEKESTERKAIVIQVEEIIAGILVDQVLDVIYVPPADVASIPTALSRQHQAFFRGVVAYDPKPLTILNLQQLFSQGDLVVDQAA